MSDHIAIDFETFYSKKRKISVRTMIAEQYCRHPEFDPYMISASDGKACWAGHPRDFNWSTLTGRTVVSHNKYFDLNVWLEVARRGWCPAPDYKEFHCTANLTSYLCNRRSLEMSMEHLLGVRVVKDARSDAAEKNWPKDFSTDEQRVMLDYARKDAFYCWTLFDRFADKWPQWERDLSNQTIAQGMRGVQIDTELLDAYLMQSHEALEATKKLLPWMNDEGDDWEEFTAKPTSIKCIAEQCRRVGIPCPPVKAEGEDDYLEWEAIYSKGHPWIKALTGWRSLNKLYKTFVKMKERLRSDGTLPFGLKYFGAHTGRWAGDAGINFQNPRKKPVFINRQLLMEDDDRITDAAMKFHDETGNWPEWVLFAIDFRALIVPRPGKKMIVSDLSQIEPRVLAWLTGNAALIDLLRGGMSIYEAHARATMGWTGGKLKSEAPGTYALAKAQVLGLGYGCGWEKFITVASSMAGIDITENDPESYEEENEFSGVVERKSGYGLFSKKVVGDFRRQNPRITGLWGRLDDSLRASVGDDFTMTLPSGRKMRYEKVRCETRIEPNRETGKPQRKSVYTADADGRRKQFYGGKLTENLVQATARDVFGMHLNALECPGTVDVLFNAHDEAVLEVDESVSARDVEEVMSITPDWLAGCPIGAEAKIVQHYCK